MKQQRMRGEENPSPSAMQNGGEREGRHGEGGKRGEENSGDGSERDERAWKRWQTKRERQT